jgi:hypothetical protein
VQTAQQEHDDAKPVKPKPDAAGNPIGFFHHKAILGPKTVFPRTQAG